MRPRVPLQPPSRRPSRRCVGPARYTIDPRPGPAGDLQVLAGKEVAEDVAREVAADVGGYFVGPVGVTVGGSTMSGQPPRTGRANGSGMWLLAVLAGVAVVGVVAWIGATAAAVLAGSGPLPGVTLSTAVRAALRLPAHATHPAQAWPAAIGARLPGPALYWPATVAIAAAFATVTAVAIGWWRRVGDRGRIRLGVDTRARFATVRELVPLVVTDPVPAGRFVLGRVAGRLVATEDARRAPMVTGTRAGRRLRLLVGRDGPTAAASRRSRRARQGDKGSVAIIGPARSGKSANAAAGIRDWDHGSAVIVSVKRDLLDATVETRRARGQVLVFDPAGQIRSLNPSERARWSPLVGAATASGAQKAAGALAAAIPRAGVDGGTDYWVAQAEILLTGLLAAAALDATITMSDVARWVFTKDMPGLEGRPSEVFALVRAAAETGGPPAELAVWALGQLDAIWRLDERVRSSVYATVQTVVKPWTDPTVAESAYPFDPATGEQVGFVDLDWLDADDNTLYLVAPLADQQRLSPVLGGLLGALKDQAYDRDVSGRPLTRPMLMVIDEAGNMPLAWLPEVASTCAGIGILLVTIWQSKAQLDAAYNRLADSVLTNHLTKIVFAGCSDESTLAYISRLLGDEEVTARSRSFDVGAGGGPRSVTEQIHREALAPFHLLRQVRPGEAVLIHATLPPAHLHGRRWWEDDTTITRRRRRTGRGTGHPSKKAGSGGGRGGGSEGTCPSTITPTTPVTSGA